MSRDVSCGLDKGLIVGVERVFFSHLQFVDDTSFFLKLNADSFVNILSILGFFEAISGAKIIIAKSD